MYQALIVEDDPQVAQINSGFLELSGFSVAGVAADAGQALELLRKTPVHLVLLDIYLPGGSGLQILRELRSGQQPVEVIVVSAAKDSAQIREAFRMGCLDYIIKPFTYERLRDALNKFQQRLRLLDKEFLDQSEVDLLAARQSSAREEDAALPKGIDKLTLRLVCRRLLERTAPSGVQDVAADLRISRVSAKKYLDFLCEQKALRQTYVYGSKGRPASLYQAAGATGRQGLEKWAGQQ